ncbi:hypothetical protein VTN31DRAFT_5048 [Thermomyces dupontii]|uniref:uncharacterized protein n=1 Tax=Talaromyces thermophilus TaxID=28565 RepID=UPI003743C8D0
MIDLIRFLFQPDWRLDLGFGQACILAWDLLAEFPGIRCLYNEFCRNMCSFTALSRLAVGDISRPAVLHNYKQKNPNLQPLISCTYSILIIARHMSTEAFSIPCTRGKTYLSSRSGFGSTVIPSPIQALFRQAVLLLPELEKSMTEIDLKFSGMRVQRLLGFPSASTRLCEYGMH